MSDRFVRLVLPDEMLKELAALAEEEKVALSKPQPADNTSEPLNAPLAGADIIIAAKVVTAVFTAGTAALTFAGKLLELLRRYNKPVRVVSATDPSRQRQLNAGMTAGDIKEALDDV